MSHAKNEFAETRDPIPITDDWWVVQAPKVCNYVNAGKLKVILFLEQFDDSTADYVQNSDKIPSNRR